MTTTHDSTSASSVAPVALVTGGSAGLGRALAVALAQQGWTVITDGRNADRLREAHGDNAVRTIAGDVTDPEHKAELVTAVQQLGRLDLLVNNASTLGPTPLPALAKVSVADLREVWQTNIGAPLVLTGHLIDVLEQNAGTLLSISSDAAIEHYEGWGLYGASKAGLDHVTLTYGAEHPGIRAYAVDPGDMRTAMHQAAFPGEDISDRPTPESVVPRILNLLEQRPRSGRYRAADFGAEVSA